MWILWFLKFLSVVLPPWDPLTIPRLPLMLLHRVMVGLLIIASRNQFNFIRSRELPSSRSCNVRTMFSVGGFSQEGDMSTSIKVWAQWYHHRRLYVGLVELVDSAVRSDSYLLCRGAFETHFRAFVDRTSVSQPPTLHPISIRTRTQQQNSDGQREIEMFCKSRCWRSR